MNFFKQKSLLISLFFSTLFFSNTASAQLFMKLQWMTQDSVWGVFVKADSTIQPSQNILVGSGQITIVAPTGFKIKKLTSYMGTWIENANIIGPEENREMDYISFGFQPGGSTSELGEQEEALILTFSSQNIECPSALFLIEDNDPFAQYPNSKNTNPGNDLKLFDIGNQRAIYQYIGNYGLEAWRCDNQNNITTSIEDFKRKKVIKAFPNPFHQQLIFELIDKTTSPLIEVQLFDNLGRLIKTSKMETPRLKMEVLDGNALYFYKIIDLKEHKLIESGKLVRR